jgi:hypothetical protein
MHDTRWDEIAVAASDAVYVNWEAEGGYNVN